MATSEILPSRAATAPRNYSRRCQTLRVGGRWPGQHQRTYPQINGLALQGCVVKKDTPHTYRTSRFEGMPRRSGDRLGHDRRTRQRSRPGASPLGATGGTEAATGEKTVSRSESTFLLARRSLRGGGAVPKGSGVPTGLLRAGAAVTPPSPPFARLLARSFMIQTPTAGCARRLFFRRTLPGNNRPGS